jgi:hypothetical protein
MTNLELEALLVKLEHRVEILEAAALRANAGPARTPTPAGQRVQPEGASVRTVIEKITMPPAAELQKLLDVVLTTYPKLRTWSPGDRYATSDAFEFFNQFACAFAYISRTGRAATIDRKYSLDFWTAQAEDFCRRQQMPVNSISGSSFLAAVLASGDIPFTVPDGWGNSWSFGLQPWGGLPATALWCDVLRDQKINDPVPGPYKAPAGSGFNVRQERSAG